MKRYGRVSSEGFVTLVFECKSKPLTKDLVELNKDVQSGDQVEIKNNIAYKTKKKKFLGVFG